MFSVRSLVTVLILITQAKVSADTESAVHCSDIESETILDFKNATLGLSNLDIEGGELRFENVGSYREGDAMTPIDLVVKKAPGTTYKPKNLGNNKLNGFFGVINVHSDNGEGTFDFCFVNPENEENVSLDAFFFSFYDMDGATDEKGLESISLKSNTFTDFFVTNTSEIEYSESNGFMKFDATKNGKGEDNPTDPNDLSLLQQNRGVVFQMESTDCFQVKMSVTCPGNECKKSGGRNFLFAGRAKQLVPKCAPKPTSFPTGEPTSSPTSSPTGGPTSSPTSSPTGGPTSSPTSSPTGGPTASPSARPTAFGSSSPTSSAHPSRQPSASPTQSTYPSSAPTDTPTTSSPTSSPTGGPTRSPTPSPTGGPTKLPTSSPTRGPTDAPTGTPTKSVSAKPTTLGSTSPTLSMQPTKEPTEAPVTNSPTKGPTSTPLTPEPTTSPQTIAPTSTPTSTPTLTPTGPDPETTVPTQKETSPQTLYPTLQPTTPTPTKIPSRYNPGGSKTKPPSTEKDKNQGANGDPHFKTWSGERYDFHGICDLILLTNPKFNDNLGMDIYIRSKKTKQWSYISTAVIRIGVETFEVSGRKDGDTYWVNGIEGDGEGDDSLWDKRTNIAGYSITYRSVHSTQREYVIDLGESNEKIIFKTWKDFVRVDVVNPRDEDFTGSLGLMGSYPDGKIVSRSNPLSLMKDKNAFGQEWQVLSSDPKLFHSLEGPQHPTQCELPSKSSLRRRLSKSKISREDAEVSCSNISDNEERDLCIFDVMATNNKATAGAY